MLFSKNERFGQDINADQRDWLFSTPQKKSYLFQNKLLPMSLHKVWKENERFRLVFRKMLDLLVFMPKTRFMNASTGDSRSVLGRFLVGF
jgi:hypothetical protein